MAERTLSGAEMGAEVKSKSEVELPETEKLKNEKIETNSALDFRNYRSRGDYSAHCQSVHRTFR